MPTNSLLLLVIQINELVDTPSPDACWEWRGATNDSGYGIVQTKAAKALGFKYVHRIMWTYHVGPIPDGKILMHSCDNRTCCNPRHLSVGTRPENSFDMQQKGRGKPGRTDLSHCPRGHELAGDNLKIKVKKGRYRDYVTRNCRTCERELQRERRAGRARDNKAIHLPSD